ncbi:MAG TPA: hypothetical protein VMQ51_00130 [Candidatus Binatia bacterium]|nr:hypothetical protein [Candidatus Binatia bacterium]
MGAAVRRAVALAAAALALGACAGARIEHGVFHAPSGYRVALPPDGAWRIVDDSRADLELRHRTASAGMLVNGACDPAIARRTPDVLDLHLLMGLRDRVELERGEAPVDGRVASHRLLEGRMRQSEERVRVETYTLRGERCVWDLLFVAAPAAFAAARGDFQRFVESFRGE